MRVAASRCFLCVKRVFTSAMLWCSLSSVLTLCVCSPLCRALDISDNSNIAILPDTLTLLGQLSYVGLAFGFLLK